MESSSLPTDKKASRSGPLMVFVVAAIIILSIAAFLIFHPSQPGTNQTTPTPTSKQ